MRSKNIRKSAWRFYKHTNMKRPTPKKAVSETLIKELEGIRSDLVRLKLEQRSLRAKIDVLLAKQLRKKISRA